MGIADKVSRSVVAQVESGQAVESVLLSFFRPEDGGEEIRVGGNVVVNREAIRGNAYFGGIATRFGHNPVEVKTIEGHEFRGFDGIDNAGRLTRFKIGDLLSSRAFDKITLTEIAGFESSNDRA